MVCCERGYVAVVSEMYNVLIYERLTSELVDCDAWTSAWTMGYDVPRSREVLRSATTRS